MEQKKKGGIALDKKLFTSKLVENGLTQASFAKAIHKSKNTVNAWANNKSFPNTDDVDLMCEALNIKSDKEKAQIFLTHPSQFRTRRKENEQ